MLLKDKFVEYCKKINADIMHSLPYAIEMHEKYPHLYKAQEQALRLRFTTNTPDDYQIDPTYKEPKSLAEMRQLIYQQKLLPNFFEDGSGALIVSTFGLLKSDFLPEFLIWNNFDEANHLRHKGMMITNYKAYKTGKEQMARIARDRELGKRFIQTSISR